MTPVWLKDVVGAFSPLTTEQLQQLGAELATDESAIRSPSNLRRLPGMSTAEVTHLARIVRELCDIHSIATAELQFVIATIIDVRELRPGERDRVDIVCTAPDRMGVPVRTTYATAVEMIRGVRERVLVVGYVFTEGMAALAGELGAVSACGVDVRFIGNRLEEQRATIRRIWPQNAAPPRLFTRDRDSTNEMASLHAKLLICDGRNALVTSANFSRHGLHENIEIGVRFESGSVKRLEEFVMALIGQDEVREIDWQV